MALQSFTEEIEYLGYNLVVAGTFSPALVSSDYDQPDDPAEVDIETILLGETDITEMLNSLVETIGIDTKMMQVRSASDVIADLVYKKLEL